MKGGIGMEELRIYTVKEVADLLKVSKMTVSRYIKAGKLKSSKLGRMYRIADDDLRKFLEDCKQA